MRNPLTVIGGNIMRLQKKVDPASPLHRTYETILKENERLEAMVRDAATYSELYQKEPAISEVSLESVISRALKILILNGCLTREQNVSSSSLCRPKRSQPLSDEAGRLRDKGTKAQSRKPFFDIPLPLCSFMHLSFFGFVPMCLCTFVSPSRRQDTLMAL